MAKCKSDQVDHYNDCYYYNLRAYENESQDDEQQPWLRTGIDRRAKSGRSSSSSLSSSTYASAFPPNSHSSACFTAKKYILTTLVLVNIVALTHYSLFVFTITDVALRSFAPHRLQPEQYLRAKRIVFCTFSALIGTILVLQIVFLVAIYREHRCMTAAYVALISLATVLAAIKSFYDIYFATSAIWLAATAVMAALYWLDLRDRKISIDLDDRGQ